MSCVAQDCQTARKNASNCLGCAKNGTHDGYEYEFIECAFVGGFSGYELGGVFQGAPLRKWFVLILDEFLIVCHVAFLFVVWFGLGLV